MQHTYFPSGVCSREFNFEIDDNNRIVFLEVNGGCDGNLKGIGSLVKGMDADEVIKRLRGITCGRKNTSCPDQFARALESLKEEQ